MMPKSFLSEEPFVEQAKHGCGVLVGYAHSLEENKGIYIKMKVSDLPFGKTALFLM